MEKKENIELRSEKLRNIIGEIPPRVIRSGTGALFLVLAGLFLGAYLIRFDRSIEADAVIFRTANSYGVKIYIPACNKDLIKKGSIVFLDFSNIQNIAGSNMITKIQSMENNVVISEKGGFVPAYADIKNEPVTTSGDTLCITGSLNIRAKINIGKFSLIERFLSK